METSFLNQWFSGGDTKAICWTLIHSLWIGLIIALLAGLVIMFTRKSAAQLRYRLLCGILVLFVLAVSVIFYIEVRTTGAVQTSPNNVKLLINPVNINIIEHGIATPQVSPVKVVINFLDSYVSIIFMIWLLFFMMKSLKMVGGLLYIQRIRTYKVHEVSEELKHRIETFSRQIGIRETIRLVQSELVKVPVAVGWLKPVILLPIGIILQLTPEQLDGILWHELAHIRRRDYLVNILQGLVETVFFFNPGLLWLSALIRAEREACCDDMVLSQLQKKANYLEALLSFGFGEYKQPHLAMGIGSGNQLRDRLKRMISQENKRLGVVEKIVLVSGIVVLSAFAGLTKANTTRTGHLTEAPAIEKAPGSNKMNMAVDTASAPQNLNTVIPEAVALNNKADTSMHLLARQYEWSTSEPGITYYLSAEDAAGAKYRFTITRFKLVALTVNGDDVQKRALHKYAYLLKHVPPPPPPPPVKPHASAGKTDTPVHFASVQNMQQNEPQQPQQPPVPPKPPTLDKMISDVTNDLINEHIIKDKNGLITVKLTNTELLVNGVKQPDEIQKRLCSKYYPGNSKLSNNPNYGLYYNARTHGVALGDFNLDLDAL